MEIKLGFKPFKEDWLNCYHQTIFSVLTTIEPSYELAAYINDYRYIISLEETPSKAKFNTLFIKPVNNFGIKYLDESLALSKPFTFQDNDYFGFIKELINKGKLVTVGVDLFYWIPNSLCWKRYHWEHYSFINGLGLNDKKVFYVFDESYEGFGEYKVPEKRFRIAVKHSTLDPHGYLLDAPENVGAYKLSLDEIINNAKQLAKELELLSMNLQPLWHLSEDDFSTGEWRDLNVMYLHQIINRHKANEVLIDELYKNGVVNTTTLNLFRRYSRNLQLGWKSVKNNLLKAYFSCTPQIYVQKINEKCKDLFKTEFKMWDAFLSGIA